MKGKMFLKSALSLLLIALTSCSSVSLKNWSVRILNPGYCPGRHTDYFVVVPITLKNIGTVSKSPSLDLEFNIIDSDGAFYDNLLPNSSAPGYDFYENLTLQLEPEIDFDRDLVFNDILPDDEVNILIGFWLQNKTTFDAKTIRLRMQERN
ncbi:MAG: hypothetical protein KKD28_07170 [Chloroflexi bacterium]|nr:hypothetical protein [Chloroflexota bacterium]